MTHLPLMSRGKITIGTGESVPPAALFMPTSAKERQHLLDIEIADEPTESDLALWEKIAANAPGMTKPAPATPAAPAAPAADAPAAPAADAGDPDLG